MHLEQENQTELWWDPECELSNGAYCYISIHLTFPHSSLIQGQEWPQNLLAIVEEIVSEEPEPLRKPEFVFEWTERAAMKNYMVLGKYNFDLHAALEAQHGTPLAYGSEFRSPEVLQKLLHLHPSWPRLQKILDRGSLWPLLDISEEDRLLDLEAALTFGNHKGAVKQPDLLKELCFKDVKHAYALPLPLKMIRRIPGLHLAPVNIAAQNTIDEHGRIIPKDRLTHDQSFTYPDGSGSSVNNRVLVEELSPCMFGGCFRRMINWIAAARWKYPGRRIVMSKIDFKSAYRRMHINMEIARQTCIHLPEEELILMALRLTFGGAPCPSEWGEMSETICDLTNAILSDSSWDPKLMRSPNQDLVPKEPMLPDTVGFGEARQLFVDIPINPRGKNEVFIDDNCTLGVDLPGTDNVLCVESAAMLAIYAVARPKHKDEPIPREWMEALISWQQKQEQQRSNSPWVGR